MPIEFTRNPKKEILEVTYFEKDFKKILSLSTQIESIINNNDEVSYILIKELLSLISVSRFEFQLKIIAEFEKIERHTIREFSKDKTFIFKEIKGDEYLPELPSDFIIPTNFPNAQLNNDSHPAYPYYFSIVDMLKQLFKGLKEDYYEMDKQYKGKELKYSLTDYMFKNMRAYRNKLSRSLRRKVTPYQLHAIIAFILIELGYSINNTKRTEDLANAVRNYLSSEKRKKAYAKKKKARNL